MDFVPIKQEFPEEEGVGEEDLLQVKMEEEPDPLELEESDDDNWEEDEEDLEEGEGEEEETSFAAAFATAPPTTSSNLVKCHQCGFCYISQISFKNHLVSCQKKHGGNNTASQEEPSTSAAAKSRSAEEEREEAKRSIKIMELSCFSQFEYFSKGTSKDKGKMKPTSSYSTLCHRCRPCNEFFPDIRFFARHAYVHTFVRMGAEDEQYSVCPDCGKDFPEGAASAAAAVHASNCDGAIREVFPCALCYVIFTRKDSLRRHLREHAGIQAQQPNGGGRRRHDRPVGRCPMCPRKFGGGAVLDWHLKSHAGQQSLTKGIQLDKNVKATRGGKTRLFWCELCRKALCSDASLKRHRIRMHQSERFVCDLCKESKSTKESLEQHLKTRHGTRSSSTPKFSCDFCGQSFNRASNLAAHVAAYKGLEHGAAGKATASPLMTSKMNTVFPVKKEEDDDDGTPTVRSPIKTYARKKRVKTEPGVFAEVTVKQEPMAAENDDGD